MVVEYIRYVVKAEQHSGERNYQRAYANCRKASWPRRRECSAYETNAVPGFFSEDAKGLDFANRNGGPRGHVQGSAKVPQTFPAFLEGHFGGFNVGANRRNGATNAHGCSTTK